ncbi:hypothetical protein TrRE_jg5716 [Triparma retinervis]|uniref:diacylglycerol O-acyltransferase n=1 Tax=Triparma retinervis TaxID=2557542 RepID=A0A9W7AFL6_9STRA|nr:hypothetical protein TrRE_jg5716 [Triparma retinervis]
MLFVLDGSPDWSSSHPLARFYRNPKVHDFFRSLPLWSWSRLYFNAELVKTTDLDPSVNHLMCYHPHGIISMGLQTSLGMDACSFKSAFPGINRHVATLVASFKIPLFREWILLHGFVSCSSPTMKKVLSTPKASLVLVPGGANEALYSHPGTFKVHIKRRKGFCRVALQAGAALVPVVGFGENELYHTLDNGGGGMGGGLYKAQVWAMKRMSFSFPIMTHLLPRREKIVVVVGEPIGGPYDQKGRERKIIENPTQEEIDQLHKRYVEGLEKLWNDHKDEYGKGIKFENA